MLEQEQQYTALGLQLLERLVAQPSVSANGHDTREMHDAADLTEQLLREAGFTTQRLAIEGAPPIIYGEQQGESPFTVLLYNHYDVQPPEPLNLWETAPFEPTRRDGMLYGRGTADNKGELAARLAAIHALRGAHGTLPLTVRWVIEGEEEVGSPHFGEIIKPHVALLRADVCLWEGTSFDPEGRPKLNLGAKGMLYVQLEVEAMSSDAHSGNATVLPSAAWRLVQALGSLRSPEGRVQIPGFYDPVRQPTEEERAVFADNNPEHQALMLAQFGLTEFVEGLSGAALEERKVYSPTCNIAGLHSGYSGEGIKTVLPARAMAKIDFRLVPDQDPKQVASALRAHLDASGYQDVVVRVLEGCKPVTTPLAAAVTRRAMVIAESFEGKKPLISLLTGGSLPLLEPLQDYVGVPGLAMPGNPTYWANRMHAPNEHIRLQDMDAAVQFNIFQFKEMAGA